MLRVTRLTSSAHSTVRHDPAEGSRWRCTTCGRYLRDRSEVRAHWALYSDGHSLFGRLNTSRVYHQTVEGLHRRGMIVTPPDEAFGG